MTSIDPYTGLDAAAFVDPLAALIAELYPLPRSITGDGVRRSLEILARVAPIEVHEVPSGTPVLDWTVPDEWNLRRAWLADASGNHVVDTEVSNLHVLNYSEPAHVRAPLDELRPNLLTDPLRPDHVPYRTSYYARRWGLCLSQRQLDALPDGEYEVVIDTTLAPGSLTYGECVLPGATDDEILLSTHVCHPSLANDNCAGMALLATLLAAIADRPRRHTIRALFVPGTIGSITWLARNDERTGRIRHGLVLNNVGDRAAFTYKRSRRGDGAVDRVAPLVLEELEPGARMVDFSPYGYDERQYCSPGYDLAVGALSRSVFGYPEYHTSADDLSFVDPPSVSRSLVAVAAVVEALDNERCYVNLSPKGEPQLGRRGLYAVIGGETHGKQFEMALLWLLNQSDGTRPLSQIAARAELPLSLVIRAAAALVDAGLLAEA